MPNRFYSLLALLGLIVTGCADNATEAPAPAPELVQPVRVPVVMTMTKAGASAKALFVVSDRPVRTASFANHLFSSTTTLTTPDRYAVGIERARLAQDTVYLSLYYHDVQATGFVGPAAGESVQVQVANRAPVTLRVDAATLRNPANAWTQGVWQNSGVELAIGL